MGAIRKISIALTEEMAVSVDQAVASGDYATTSEVIREALRLWKGQRLTSDVAVLRRLWDDGVASGPGVAGDFDPEDIARRGRERMATAKQ
jgi:antitoxin ParD1/3/4